MKTMTKKQKNGQGVITVMISLMLTGILSLGTMVIEAGRLQGARTQLDDANLSAGTSMIAAYNSTLYERYGLLAIDNELFDVGRYREYLDFNSDRAPGYEGNNISTFYTVDTGEVEGLYNLTYPSVLKRQILSRAKFHVIPQDYSLNYYNMDHFLSDYQNKASYVMDALASVDASPANRGTMDDVPADMRRALSQLYGTFSKIKRYDEAYNVILTSSDMAKLPSVTGTVAHAVSADDMDIIANSVKDATTVLGSTGSLLASNAGAEYTEIDVSFNASSVASLMDAFPLMENTPAIASDITGICRKSVQQINAGLNILSADKEGTLLLNSYIAGYFPNKNYIIEGYTGLPKGSAVSGLNNATFSGACMEYVFEGNAKETVNQEKAYDYIIATRLVNNLYATIVNSSSFNRNSACSVAAHIAWAYYETYADAELLAKYNASVPLSKASMILPINNASAVNGAFATQDFLNAMKSLGILRKNGEENVFVVNGYDKTNYRDALALALWFVPNSDKMLRVADLVQLEMRYREQHVEKSTASFLMSEQNTFCRVKCTGKLNSILPVVSLSSSDSVKGTSIQSIKYVGY